MAPLVDEPLVTRVLEFGCGRPLAFCSVSADAESSREFGLRVLRSVGSYWAVPLGWVAKW